MSDKVVFVRKCCKCGEILSAEVMKRPIGTKPEVEIVYSHGYCRACVEDVNEDLRRRGIGEMG